MIMVSVECQPNVHKDKEVRHIWSKANIPAIKQDLDNTHWREELDQKTVEEGWNFIKSTLEETISRNVPTSKGRIKFKHPWMTREILQLI
jgi:hypothetical protein